MMQVSKSCIRLSTLKGELKTKKHSEFSHIGVLRSIQISETVNEIHPEKLEDIFYSIAHFNIRFATGKEAHSRSILIGFIGYQRFI